MISPNAIDSTVVLTIPMRAEYVSIARLTAAGVANRLGFDIETIEDIKVSLSEVCNRIISTQDKFAEGYNAECKIKFILSRDSLGIDFYVDNMGMLEYFAPDGASSHADICAAGFSIDNDKLLNDVQAHGDRPIEEYYKDQLQLSLITLLMDEFVVHPKESCLVSMKKYLD